MTWLLYVTMFLQLESFISYQQTLSKFLVWFWSVIFNICNSLGKIAILNLKSTILELFNAEQVWPNVLNVQEILDVVVDTCKNDTNSICGNLHIR